MSNLPALVILLLLFLLSSSSPLAAQSIILPKVISFTGAPDYSQAELLAVTGLKPGAISSQAGVEAAARHLADTGLFADVRFGSNATGLIFSLKPMAPEDLFPAHFTNFIWWQPDELATALKSRVPLFHGSIPLSGNLQDEVIAALNKLLAERKVTAQITAVPFVPASGGTPTAINFSIDTPKVIVHSLTLQQASAAMQPKLAPAIKNLTDKPYVDGVTAATISNDVSEVYRSSGYLDVTLTGLTHAEPQITPEAINVDFTAAVTEGEPYRLSALNWSGSEIMSSADFSKIIKLKPEDIASLQALRQSLAVIANAYFAKGYQDAKVQAPQVLDHATHHVSYTVNVVPGPQYHLHTINTIGLSPEQKKQFDAAWQMHPGDVYDVTYMTSFLTQKNSPQALRGYSAKYRAVSQPDTHLVDLTITFVAGGDLVEVH